MRFRQGYLSGWSRAGYDIGDLVQGSYDLALLAAAWDRRSGCIAEAPNLNLKFALLLTFASRDPLGIQEANEGKLRAYLSRTGCVVESVTSVSEDVELEWTRIWNAAKSLAGKRSQRVFIDLTGCPRFYSLGLLAALFATGMASEICLFYAEGQYDSSPYLSDPLDVPFSIGQWRNLPIPFLQGEVDPTKGKYFLVSVGFEGAKTARVLAREDPERISVLYPIPGVAKGYEAEVTERNREIVMRFQVPSEQSISAEAGDAVLV